MSKGIKRVRQSINQRKKMRSLDLKDNAKIESHRAFSLPTEEEQHGYLPGLPEQNRNTKQDVKIVRGFITKGILSVILFLGILFLLTNEGEYFSDSKTFVKEALTEEFPFAKIHGFYQETFGKPLALVPGQADQLADKQLALPVSGSIAETFDRNGTGVMIAPKSASTVFSMNDGVVVFAGNDRETNKTVIVQHTDGSKSTYGYLSTINVHLYQFIQTSQKIGGFAGNGKDNKIYFSIEKNKQYVDPVEVIKVNGGP